MLCNLIKMLITQVYPAHEIIVIDQSFANSPETTTSLRTWAGTNTIKWLKQAEPNASKARNRGAVAATGDILLFLDDDIIVAETFLLNYSDALHNSNAVAVAGPVLEGDLSTVNSLPKKALDPDVGWLYFPKNYAKNCITSFLMAGNVAIRRPVFFEVGGMDENYVKGAYREESDFAMRLKRRGYSVHFCPECSLRHLGVSSVSEGGARSWWRSGSGWYFHHCVGDWYFMLGFATSKTWAALLWRSLRYFIVNRPTLTNPRKTITACALWLAAIPVAIRQRLEGPKLIAPSSLTASQETTLCPL